MRLFISAILWGLIATTAAAAGPGQAAIASAHPTATEAGFEVLAQGGNAFDAAVAVSATLAVVEPYSSGLGGGGFWLLHRAEDGRNIMVDGREVAPERARRNMYQNARGEVVPERSIDGPLAAGIPGEPAALVHIAEKYGRLPLRTSLAPAIRAAKDGFLVTPHYRKMAAFRLKALRDSAVAARVFLKDNAVPPLGYRIIQVDLAETLRRLAENGRDGFYDGTLARQLTMGVQRAGGIWLESDLKNYRIKEREPVVGQYHDARIISAAPPSSGGVALATMFNILEQFDLKSMKPVERHHLIIEAMRRAYRDRAEYLGDPDFYEVPVARLTSEAYAKKLAKDIDRDEATRSETLPAITDKSRHTTHFSIIDRDGNRVAATLSINYPFGSGFMPERTGVLLNDEMDDFSAKPGVPNVYGLVGAEANAIAPGKRMLSSMSPTFVETPERIGVIGTPGGSRIITMVFHGIRHFLDGRSAAEIVSQPRYHHQYLPDTVQHEVDAFTDDELAQLRLLEHRFKALEDRYGNMQVVIWNKNNKTLDAASDPRGEGRADVR